MNGRVDLDPVRLPSIEFRLDQSLWLWVSSITAQPSQPCRSIVEVVEGVAQPVTRTTTSFKMRCSSSPMCAGLRVELLLQLKLLELLLGPRQERLQVQDVLLVIAHVCQPLC